eukprot:PhF_6_TR19293/c0_g1_i1/m.28362
MPPRFQNCPYCGRGYGSMSLAIHVKQCGSKNLPDPRIGKPLAPMDSFGPPKLGGRPEMRTEAPPARRTSLPATSGRSGGGTGFGGGMPVSNFSQIPAQPTAPMHLLRCRRCNRTFTRDRIERHESACIAGKPKRRVFDAAVKRRPEDAGGSILGPPRRGQARTQPRGSTTVSRAPPAPRSNWRQQHAEFQAAIRAARRIPVPKKSTMDVSSTSHAGGGQRNARAGVRELQPPANRAGFRNCIVPGSPEAMRLARGSRGGNPFGSDIPPSSNYNQVRVVGGNGPPQRSVVNNMQTNNVQRGVPNPPYHVGNTNMQSVNPPYQVGQRVRTNSLRK